MKYEIKDGKLIIDIESIYNDEKQEDLVKLNKAGFVPDSEELDQDYINNKKIGKPITYNISNDRPPDIDFVSAKEKQLNTIPSKNPNRFNTGQLLITMSAEERQDFDQISDIDNGIYGYDRIRIFDSMGRKSDKVHLINDGPDVMYALLNRTGVDDDTGIWTHQSEEELEKNWVTSEDKMKESWSSNETMIYPGEKWTFFDVYEIRVRSATQGNKYRVTEDDVVGNTIRQVM